MAKKKIFTITVCSLSILIIGLVIYFYLINDRKDDNDSTMFLSSQDTSLSLSLAPILYCNKQEYFNLQDVYVIMHPEKPIIAYHLFWDDDIDFPNDQHPNDHEIIWVKYNDAGAVVNLWTYWHGKILEQNFTAGDNNTRPVVYVQWGKHGLLPSNWNDKFSLRPKTEIFLHYLFWRYRYAHKSGEIDKNWPKRYNGSFASYISFERQIDTKTIIKKENILTGLDVSVMIQSRYGENFKHKIEWP
ncbi:MAG: hypothetical protein COS76_03130 [Candidatus Portnoybacteria bacterium CG06_land_8_20_14_3_00_39_12]|uniref:Uncharacterized protein n=3 Tax=Bacteria candidate phyla TaxID=1783234 RepID=A0A2M8KFC8_9BACT|nr:MAG: hypothetical protein AUJ33_02650 [Parcubacteria group bacterium CG1_02_40_25]PIU74998.1 MAG: hypothetical protein COS76_03130 [Candidatus Portnoybacteria bacterium CG06_land_8_20_14_3_00_39_12]PJA01823.1 MAG: hypothetical protein COX74_00700 [bacterium (Candidatus Gribaldobacteria) CG_4_10_14_0_2_um_filter_41_16]PJE58618.1 MAG: hypothetical protein COU83_02900 [Candidatus Portnoybacteria bacterium CG10_big_fil_rev_8_21_14_0_10_40_22]